MVDWQIRQMHFEYDIVEKRPPPIPDGSVKFGFLLGTASLLIFYILSLVEIKIVAN